MAETLTDSLIELLTPVVADAGYFLENVETTRAGKYSVVRVFVDLADGPGDLDLDTLGEITPLISQALDDADPVKGSYTLEVSTPGAERELTTERHFRRAVGHSVKLVVDGEELTGVLTAVEGDNLRLETAGETSNVPRSAVSAAQIQLNNISDNANN